jgi:hypothetical protein
MERKKFLQLQHSDKSPPFFFRRIQRFQQVASNEIVGNMRRHM